MACDALDTNPSCVVDVAWIFRWSFKCVWAVCVMLLKMSLLLWLNSQHMFVVSALCNQELEDLDKWSFNIFRVAEFSNNRPLSCVMYTIFQVNKNKINLCFVNLLLLNVHSVLQVECVCVCVKSYLLLLLLLRSVSCWRRFVSQSTPLSLMWWPWRTITMET